MGYTIGDKQVAQTLVRAGREKPWTDRHCSARITEPVGIFMRTQIVKLDETAPEPDTDGRRADLHDRPEAARGDHRGR